MIDKEIIDKEITDKEIIHTESEYVVSYQQLLLKNSTAIVFNSFKLYYGVPRVKSNECVAFV